MSNPILPVPTDAEYDAPQPADITVPEDVPDMSVHTPEELQVLDAAEVEALELKVFEFKSLLDAAYALNADYAEQVAKLKDQLDKAGHELSLANHACVNMVMERQNDGTPLYKPYRKATDVALAAWRTFVQPVV